MEERLRLFNDQRNPFGLWRPLLDGNGTCDYHFGLQGAVLIQVLDETKIMFVHFKR